MMDSSAGGSGDVELNLAPIIDCFTVLITYLLVTASFLTITAVDVSISASSPSDSTPPPVTDEKPLFCTLDLTDKNEVILNLSGGNLTQDYHLVLPPKEGTWDKEALNSVLQKVHNKYEKLTDVSLSAASAVKYDDLVNLINEAKKTMPKIYISGA